MFAKGTMLCLIVMILHIHQCLNLCIEHERQALLKFEKDIYDHDNWLSSWRNGGDCCNWRGITCHNTTGNIIGLDLSSGFEGTIPPQLGNLSSLQRLIIDNWDEPRLRVDDLHWLSRLTSLTSLVMYSVDLSAAVDWFDDITKLPFISTILFWHSALSSIPMTMPSLNNFTFLQSLDLGANELNSTIPSWLLYNISSLEQLYLNDCGLYGELPLLPEQISNLKFLSLSTNNINASISETLWNLTHLTYLDLSYNQIHGSLPKTFGNYNQLETIWLNSNNITGEIPQSIGNLYRLTDLRLAYNNIEGKIPDSIGNLNRLTDLELAYNNIEGKIPDSIGNLKKLNNFYVSKNLLNGEIPHSLFNLTNLSSLDLSNNIFWGELPKSINLNYLSSVDLSNNRLNGSIFFSNQSSLVQLDISNNSFTGMFPISESITSQLGVVDLSNNRFSGTIPNVFMFHPSLISLQLGKNKFNGLIPSSLKYCKSLILLDLSENKLHGKIPPWIGGTLLSLSLLNLRSNNLTGQIPKELSYLTSLQIMDLSHNHISGNFSLHFDNFTLMTKEKNKTFVMARGNIWLTKEGIVRNYIAGALQEAIVIDVSSNEISGEISNGITKLIGLKFLNLSRNHFIGNIPKNIGAIKDLEMLDLSSNKLSGEIPSTMAEMTFLNFLNLSYNNLSGMIPEGNQFRTFNDPSIYSGNSNLCGWPLPKCVGSNGNNTNFDGKENEEDEYFYERTWINAGTVVEFLISSWGTFITLLFNQSMRRLYFYYFDKLYDLIGLQFHFGIAKIKSKIMKIEME